MKKIILVCLILSLYAARLIQLSETRNSGIPEDDYLINNIKQKTGALPSGNRGSVVASSGLLSHKSEFEDELQDGPVNNNAKKVRTGRIMIADGIDGCYNSFQHKPE